MDLWAQRADRIIGSNLFEMFIIGVILVNAALLGLGTAPRIDLDYADWLRLGFQVALGIFVAEAVLKMFALWPHPLRYFRDGWNVFDFLVIVLALIPATGQLALVARLARLLRVVRLITTIRDLRLIVAALVRSIPSVFHVLMLMSIVVYIYAIMGYYMFHENDPDAWGSLSKSVLTLFNMLTLDDWARVMYKAMEVQPIAWIYFVSYVVIGTFVVINLFIAIIVNNLDEAKLDRLRDLQRPVTRDELLEELRATQEALQRLESRIRNSEDS